jgi:hypothetical protein
VVKYFAKGITEEKKRPRKVKVVFAGAARPAKAFYGRCRLAALVAPRRLQRLEFRPAFGAGGGVTSFTNLRITDNAGNRE